MFLDPVLQLACSTMLTAIYQFFCQEDGDEDGDEPWDDGDGDDGDDGDYYDENDEGDDGDDPYGDPNQYPPLHGAPPPYNGYPGPPVAYGPYAYAQPYNNPAYYGPG